MSVAALHVRREGCVGGLGGGVYLHTLADTHQPRSGREATEAGADYDDIYGFHGVTGRAGWLHGYI